MNTNFANTAATKGDIIGWASLIPAIGFVVPVFTNGFSVIGKFDLMFQSLGAKLPTMTNIFIAIGDPWIALIPLTMVVVSAVILYRSKSNTVKMWTGITTLLLTIVYFKLLISAIFGPILELQKQLS